MRLILRSDIERWAGSFDAKGNLPILVSRLILAITRRDTTANFPSGNAVFIGGWDGVVKSNQASNYVPLGISLWELGAEGNPKKKAEDDYKKRTKDPLDYNPSECTFVFVTPFYWKQKSSWAKSKIAEDVWKDVIAYDSTDLEQWLDLTPAVSRWFSSYISKYPADGIITIEEFWDEWSIGPKGQLPPQIITAGRERESSELIGFLNGPQAIKAIKASSKREAIAFIIASAMISEKESNDYFMSKSLVLNSDAAFRSVRINMTSLNLIANFEENNNLYAAVSKGHHVLVPLGPDDTLNIDSINLPLIDRDGQIKALQSMGFSNEDSVKFSKEAGRNVTILRRILKFPHSNPSWNKENDVREIIPAILLGKWDNSRIGDRQLLEELSGEKYDDYILKVAKWGNADIPLFIQIGEMWRLISPMDAVANLSTFLSIADLKRLSESFLEVYKKRNAFLPKDPNNPYADFVTPQHVYSSWVREGLVQSLILIALYGDGLHISQLNSSQDWVDSVISDLLSNASGELWCSLNTEMPLIAEASPKSFLEAVDTSLESVDRPIMEMFIERDNFLYPRGNFTGLLWALEGLSWNPDYLPDAAIILARLASINPKVSITNKPINSLKEIFKSWHWQTFAAFDDRMSVLEAISRTEKKTAWELLLTMLPEHHGIAHNTHPMRWRLFESGFSNRYMVQEIVKTHERVVDLLMSIFDYSDKQLSELLEKTEMDHANRKRVIDFSISVFPDIDKGDFETWKTLRRMLSHHRSFPNADWALPEAVLADYDRLYVMTAPEDKILRNIWLFNEEGSTVAEGNTSKIIGVERKGDYEAQERKVEQNRANALREIYEEYGIDKIIELVPTVKHAYEMGAALAKITQKKRDSLAVSVSLSIKGSERFFAYGYFHKLFSPFNMAKFSRFFKALQASGADETTLGYLLVPIRQDRQLWDYIETHSETVQSVYWRNIIPYVYHSSNEDKIYAIKKLMQFERFGRAIDCAQHSASAVPTQLIIELLEQAAKNQQEDDKLDPYETSRLFEELDKREDLDTQALFQLEWVYLPLLARYGNARSPKLLHRELSTNPVFFIDMVRLAYMPKSKELIEGEKKNLTDEQLRNRSKFAFDLLYSWKTIPGLTESGLIDKDFIMNWITEARSMGRKFERDEVVDMIIGQVLAQYPEDGGNWPPVVICEIIERINTKALKSNFSSAVYNKRGSSSRGPFDGGTIERNHAVYFEKLAKLHKVKFPNVSKIFASLAKGYRQDAKYMDNEAEQRKLES